MIFLGILGWGGILIATKEKGICHSRDALLSAVHSGQGLIVLSKRLGKNDLADGVLREEGILWQDILSGFP